MAELFSFFDPIEVEPGVFDREYYAQEFTDYFSALITTGVMKGAWNQLEVKANGTNMITEIDTGIAFVEAKRYANTTKLAHTHDTEVLGKNRIDRIVIRLDLRAESRFVKSFIKKGVPATVPVAPALQRDQFIYEISLAQVKIIGGQTYINANDVIDERGKTDICPWAGSKLLPSFDDNALANHMKDYKEHIPYAVATGTGADYLLSIDGITSYYEGLAVSFKANVDNTDNAPRIRINNIAYGLIKKPNGQQPKKGSMKKDAVYTVRFNGTDFILQGEGGSGTALPEDVIVLKTFTNDNGEQTGTMPNNGAQIITPKIQTANSTILRGYHNGAGYVKNMKTGVQSAYASNVIRTNANYAIYFTTSMLFEFVPVGCFIYIANTFVWIGSDTFTGEAGILFRDLNTPNSYNNPSIGRNPGGGNTGNPVLTMRPDNDYGSGVRVSGGRLYVDVQLSSGIERPRLDTYAGLIVVAWGF